MPMCKGTDSQACEDAGGVYESENDACDVDTTISIKCDAIPGFMYETTVTCEQFGSYMTMIPEAAAEYKDCSNFIAVLYLIPLFQSTYCGGLMNNKDVCPDVPDTNTNSVDPCSACDENDKNINNTNISEKCGVAVAAWYELKGIDEPEECDDNESADNENADNESATTVSAKCKYTILSTLNCIDNTYADPCSVCNENDRNSKLIGVSDKCYKEVNAWSQLPGNNIPESEECADNESASSVSAKCKYYVFSMFKCSINPCEDDYDNKLKYGNDIYSCKQLNRLKKKYRKRICTKEESARKLCAVICKNKV